MGFNCGIVGLPNVGKSTLFNALTATAAAEAANYPFCTIEPNTGRVGVPDERLETVAKLAGTTNIVRAQLEFVDIAGLVKGASHGEGLGNQFLGHIREVQAIVNVLRCFADDNVSHLEDGIDPVRDAEIVATELMLSDLERMERRAEALIKHARFGGAEAKADLRIVETVLGALWQGKPARDLTIHPDDRHRFEFLRLLTAKPVLYVCNVDEESAAHGNAYSDAVAEAAAREGAASVVISAAIEAEVAQLADPMERHEFLEALGMEDTGLGRVIAAGYRLLDLITFLTAGPNEARAWTVARGATAYDAAGLIHSDFQRGFIRAETASYDDFVALGGELGARNAGRMRQEGRDYVVHDGDVILFRFNV
jgi:ribosome-binding ATPase